MSLFPLNWVSSPPPCQYCTPVCDCTILNKEGGRYSFKVRVNCELQFFFLTLCYQTDKTMAELEIDINMKIREWDVIQVTVYDESWQPFKICFFLFFHLRLYDSFPLLWGSLTSEIKNKVNDSSIIRCLCVTESILMISDVIIYSRNQARNWLPYVALATLDWRI